MHVNILLEAVNNHQSSQSDYDIRIWYHGSTAFMERKSVYCRLPNPVRLPHQTTLTDFFYMPTSYFDGLKTCELIRYKFSVQGSGLDRGLLA